MPETRAFRTLAGYFDVLRSCNPQEVIYTYWDYQAGAWQRDHGVRIDHLLLSPGPLTAGSVGVDRGAGSKNHPTTLFGAS